MSAPDASTTRQRNPQLAEEHKNPASLSADPTKKVKRDKPAVKPPLSDVSMNKFLTYLVLGLLAVVAFYIWRITIWAADAGGYWRLLTGAGAAASAASGAASVAKSAASSKGSATASSLNYVPTKAPKGSKKPDIQSQIFALAEALGVAPADLSAAIRPLTDPTVPNPAEQQKKLEQQLEEAKANGGKDAAETDGPSVLGLMGEVFLD